MSGENPALQRWRSKIQWGLQDTNATSPVDPLPDLHQDIQEVLETQALEFPNLITLEEKETPLCRISIAEERLWSRFPRHRESLIPSL